MKVLYIVDRLPLHILIYLFANKSDQFLLLLLTRDRVTTETRTHNSCWTNQPSLPCFLYECQVSSSAVLHFNRMRNLRSLKKLILTSSSFSSHGLPEVLCEMSSLKVLNLRKCGLKSLPERYVYWDVIHNIVWNIKVNAKSPNKNQIYMNIRNQNSRW